MTAKDYLADAVRVSLRGAGALFKKGTEAMGGENIASVLVIEGAGKEAVQDKLWAKGKARNKDERAKYAKQLAKEFAEIKERLEQVVPTEAVKAAWKELVASAGEALEELNALADERFFLPGSLKARTKKRLDKVQALKERLVTKKTQAAALALDLARQVMALEKQRQDGVAQADKECKKLKKLLAGVMKKVDGAGGYETDLLADEMDADPERRSHFWRDLAKRCASEAGLKKAGAFLALVTMPIPVLSLAVAVAAGVAAVVTGVKKEVVENRAAAQALVGELNEVAFFVGRLGTATDPDSAVARFVDRFWKEAEVAMRSMTSLANQRKFKEWWTRSQNKAVIARANEAIRRSRENLRDSIAVDTNNCVRASHRRQVDEDEKKPERAGDFRPPPPAASKGHFERDVELAGMREKLGRAGEQGRVAVRGLAGSGKTWLARQFVRKHREEYDLTAWVDAETEKDARRNLADLGAFLELFAADAAVDKAALSKGALERRKKPFLLVFNNVEKWADIKDLVPASAHCDLVFTVRNADVVPEQRSFELVVRGLSGDGARAVLLPEKDEEKEAAELAKVVGGLPLALAQLRAYKEMGSRTYGKVLKEVRREKGCLPPGEDRAAADVVLRMVVAGLSPEALTALQVLSVIGPERVPVSLLEVAGVAEQLAELRRLSLVHDGGRDGLGLLVDTHRLVQNMVRKDMSAEQRRRLVFELGVFVLVMSAKFDRNNHHTWPATGRLEPHCRALLQQLPKNEKHLRFQLWQSLARFYKANSAFAEAIGAYTIMRGSVPRNSVAMASTLVNLATVYYSQGAYDKAMSMYDEALSIKETLGERHPDVASTLLGMANVHYSQGAYDKAMSLHEKALLVKKEALGERHPHVATTLGSMANVHCSKGAYDKAMALYGETLSIEKEALGERHPDVATTLGNMAIVHKSQGAYDEAMALHEEALSIKKEALGERHPDVATTLGNMAIVHNRQGAYDKAMALLKEALSIKKEALGERHPGMASTLTGMATVHHSQGAYDEAMALLKEALSIEKEALGERHPGVASTLGNVANVHNSQGAYDEAMALYGETLSIEKEALGERHPDVATTLGNMANVHHSQGAYDEAMALYEEALSIEKEALGERHPDVATTLGNMANVHHSQGAYDKAMALLKEALSIKKEALGERHPGVASTLMGMANVHHSQGAYDKAMALYEEALSIKKEALGERHPGVASTLMGMAIVHKNQGAYDEAMALHEKALSIKKEALGERHPEVGRILGNMAHSVLEQQGPGFVVAAYGLLKEIDQKLLRGDALVFFHITSGRVLAVEGKAAASLEALHRAEAAADQLPANHPRRAAILNRRAETLLTAVEPPDADAAVTALNAAAVILSNSELPDEHAAVALNKHLLGVALKLRGDASGAREAFNDALRIRKACLPPGHPHTQATESSLESLAE